MDSQHVFFLEVDYKAFIHPRVATRTATYKLYTCADAVRAYKIYKGMWPSKVISARLWGPCQIVDTWTLPLEVK